MKKLFAIIVAVAFGLSLAGVAVAADKPAAGTAAPAKAEPAKKAAKVRTHRVRGTIEALNAADGTFTVKGKKGPVDLKAGEKVKLADFAVGDNVYVRYSEGTAVSAKKITGKKGAHKGARKEAAPKTEAAPAAPATKERPGWSTVFGPPRPTRAGAPRAGGHNPPALFFLRAPGEFPCARRGPAH